MLAALVAGMSPAALNMLLLSVVAILGLTLGRVSLAGVRLGIGGVLFAGIFVGHVAEVAGVEFDHEVLHFIREFGLILFVYTIGIQVGPGFFSALKRSGLTLNLLALGIVLGGVVVTAGLHLFMGLSLPVVLGLFSGAVTNTPSLAAAQQVLGEVGASPDSLAQPGLGYAVAYPFGIAGILLTMTLIRVLFRICPEQEASSFESQHLALLPSLEGTDLIVRNPSVAGLSLREIPGMDQVTASRVLHDGVLEVALPETRLVLGDLIHLVGPRAKLDAMKVVLGETASVDLTRIESAIRVRRAVVTSPEVLGAQLSALRFPDRFNVTVSRIDRAGVQLVPSPSLKLQFGDILTLIGTEVHANEAARVLGDSEKRLQEVQFIPVFVGLALGVLLGSLPLYVPGIPVALKLGLAGGPLIAAILLARLGQLGPLVWFMPPSANHALREFGIVLFLAVVGVSSGSRFLDTLVNGDGVIWMAYAALITLLPLLIAGLFARLFLKMNYLSLCGALAGSMTDPPALAFANALSPSQAASLAYATVYPFVMCLRILAPQILVLLLWSGA